jgi:hypothetical protein
MQKAKMVFKQWLPIAVVLTAVCGLVYAAVQQSLRQGANDPQIQLAEDAADALAGGAQPASVVPEDRTDIAKSLAPFVMVFDDQGKNLTSSGLLHGQIPALPDGVLDYVRQHGEDRVTWQPEPGVRIAAVILACGGSEPGFVLAGRSLREVEIREDQIEFFAGATWLAGLLLSLVVIALGERFLSDAVR